MRKITVTYELSDEQEERLEKLTEAYRKVGSASSTDKIFESIMGTGSEWDIEQKFSATELILGIGREA